MFSGSCSLCWSLTKKWKLTGTVGGQKKVWKTRKPIREDFCSNFDSGSLFDCKRPWRRLGVAALFSCSATPALTQSLWKSHQNNTFTASSPQNLASEEQLNNTDAFWVEVQWTDEVSIEVWLKKAKVCREKGTEFHEKNTCPACCCQWWRDCFPGLEG